MTSPSSTNDGNAQEPPHKRQRRTATLAGSNRIALDVGGTGFVAAPATLTSNSTYFAALLSAHWRGNDDRSRAVRQAAGVHAPGMIKIEDVDADLLALAEFLGVERLLVAVKVRSYQNIGLGPDMSKATAEEVAAAFDRVHGGILQAVLSRSLPTSLLHTTHPKKDFAVLTFGQLDINIRHGGESFRSSIAGTLNWLSENRYTKKEGDMSFGSGPGTLVYSRVRRYASNAATNVLIENNSVEKWRTQYAVIWRSSDGGRCTIQAPAEFHDDPEIRKDPSNMTRIIDDFTFLDKNGFCSERDLILYRGEFEDIFKRVLRLKYPGKYRSLGDGVRVLKRTVEHGHD
ncbi:hypothetical protein ACHAWF_006056 [Thalassiosira exigua]